MTSSLESSLAIAAYLALFGGVGFLFVFAGLLVGRFARASAPTPEKLEIYECGEPAIGSSFVQFDLRFYVVALIFIIFDVEVAFLFPWATVFGKSTNLTQLADHPKAAVVETGAGQLQLTSAAQGVYRELGVRHPAVQVPDGRNAAAAQVELAQAARRLSRWGLGTAMIFFVVLLIGFAYEWKTGALDWVRAVSHRRQFAEDSLRPPVSPEPEPTLSA